MKHTGPTSSAKSILLSLKSVMCCHNSPGQNLSGFKTLSNTQVWTLPIGNGYFYFHHVGGGRFLCDVLKRHHPVEELGVARMGLFASNFFSKACWHLASHSKKTLASSWIKPICTFKSGLFLTATLPAKEKDRDRELIWWWWQVRMIRGTSGIFKGKSLL